MSLPNHANMLNVGDMVEVISGDLIQIRGKVTNVLQRSVIIQPTSIEMEEVEVLTSQVRKYIPLYSHVKVIDGRHTHQTGTVVAKGETTVFIITDESNEEITVRPWHVKESTEVAAGLKFLTGYQLYDLVQLNDHRVGMIVWVGLKKLIVLTDQDGPHSAYPEEIRRKIRCRNYFSFDKLKKRLAIGDSVRIVQGPSRGSTVTIRGMIKSQLFVYSSKYPKHAGITTIQSRNCVLAGLRTTTAEKPTPKFYRRARDQLLGENVCIRSRANKGLRGVVVDNTPVST